MHDPVITLLRLRYEYRQAVTSYYAGEPGAARDAAAARMAAAISELQHPILVHAAEALKGRT